MENARGLRSRREKTQRPDCAKDASRSRGNESGDFRKTRSRGAKKTAALQFGGFRFRGQIHARSGGSGDSNLRSRAQKREKTQNRRRHRCACRFLCACVCVFQLRSREHGARRTKTENFRNFFRVGAESRIRENDETHCRGSGEFARAAGRSCRRAFFCAAWRGLAARCISEQRRYRKSRHFNGYGNGGFFCAHADDFAEIARRRDV